MNLTKSLNEVRSDNDSGVTSVPGGQQWEMRNLYVENVVIALGGAISVFHRGT